jgi:predicted secreted hydrolase
MSDLFVSCSRRPHPARLSPLALAILAITTLMAACTQSPPNPQQASLTGLVTTTSGDFARAQSPRKFSFPLDHGPHPDYQTEWWYFTGNLDAADGRHFGFELTFFRRALVPADESIQRPSDWAVQQVYMAHFAITDVKSGEFRYFQRLERGAAGLAGATADPLFQVWLDDWRVEQVGPQRYSLHAALGELGLDLTMDDATGPVLQGNQGYSQKGPHPGNASYYYSLPRMISSGDISLHGQTYSVSGISWMDHEWSSSALSSGQVGWDWFGLQLDDGSELMVYDLRRADGRVDDTSSGSLIAPDGKVLHLNQSDFHIQALSSWRSPDSGSVYPSGWEIQVPSAGLALKVEPYLEDQELRVAFTYWEGAVRVSGERDGKQLSGKGYVELTGYAGSMQGQF